MPTLAEALTEAVMTYLWTLPMTARTLQGLHPELQGEIAQDLQRTLDRVLARYTITP